MHPPVIVQWTIFDTLRIDDLAAEILIEFQSKEDSRFTVRLHSEDGTDFAAIRYGEKSGSLRLQVSDREAPITQTPSAKRLHVFLDASLIEVFLDQKTAITDHSYHAPPSPLRLSIDGNANIASLDVWQIQPISKNRLTSPLCD